MEKILTQEEIDTLFRATGSYAFQVGAVDVSMARSEPFVWIRLQSSFSCQDILFPSLVDV
jgi:hypothetical protein